MKFLLLALIAPLVFKNIVGQSSNYCYGDLCPNGVSHIACKGQTDLAGICGARAIEIIMDSSSQTLITDLHNELRNRVALGNQNYTKKSSYPQASRMTTMVLENINLAWPEFA